jgi:hypothetical protein
VFNELGGHMGYKFWVVRAFIVFNIVFVLLFIPELLKQHSIEDSVLFAAMWSFLGTLAFIGSWSYQPRKGMEFALCNDITDTDDKTTNKQNNEGLEPLAKLRTATCYWPTIS